MTADQHEIIDYLVSEEGDKLLEDPKIFDPSDLTPDQRIAISIAISFKRMADMMRWVIDDTAKDAFVRTGSWRDS